MSAPLRKTTRRTGAPPGGSARDNASNASNPSSPATPMGPSTTLPSTSGSSSVAGGAGASGGRLYRRGLAAAGIVGGSLGGGLGLADSHTVAMSVAAEVEDRGAGAGTRSPHAQSATGPRDASSFPVSVAARSSGISGLGQQLPPQPQQTSAQYVRPGSSLPARHRASGLTGAGGVGSGRLQYGTQTLLREANSRIQTPTGAAASIPIPRVSGKLDGSSGTNLASAGAAVRSHSITTTGSSASVNSNTGGAAIGGGGASGSAGADPNAAGAGSPLTSSGFVPLPTRLRLSDGISCMDYHPTFRALAVGGTRQIHVVEVCSNVANEIGQLEQQQQSQSASPNRTSPTGSLPSLTSATAPFGFRNAGTFGGLVKVESVVWYPSAAEATLAFVQPSRVVTILLDALTFKTDGSFMPQQWIRSRCKTLTSPVAAGSGSTTVAVVNVPGGMNTMQTTTTSAGSTGTVRSTVTPATRSPSMTVTVSGGPLTGSGTAGSTTTAAQQNTASSSSGIMPSGPSVLRRKEWLTGRELIELNIDITYMRVEKIVWDPHTPYTLALSSPLTLFELWQVPVHGNRVFAPQLILRPPAHTARVTVRDIEFSPSDPNLIVVMVETASAGQLLLFDRRQVEIPRHLDVMGPALAAAFHPLFADLLAVCYRKEKAKTDCRIAFLRVMQDDVPGLLRTSAETAESTADAGRHHSAGLHTHHNHDKSSTSSLGSPTAMATASTTVVSGLNGRRTDGLSAATTTTTTAATSASAYTPPPRGGGGSSGLSSSPVPSTSTAMPPPQPMPLAPQYPHVLLQDVLPPIDYYACVNRLLWRPTSCGQLSPPQADHPWLTFIPDAQALLGPSGDVQGLHKRLSATSRGLTSSGLLKSPLRSGVPGGGSSSSSNSTGPNTNANTNSASGSPSDPDMSLLASQLWLATSAIANDLDVNVWDATNGYFPVCSVQYPTRDGREATNDFIWVNEVTLVSAVRGNEIVVSSLLSSTHLDRTVQSALATNANKQSATEAQNQPGRDEDGTVVAPTTAEAAAAASTPRGPTASAALASKAGSLEGAFSTATLSMMMGGSASAPHTGAPAADSALSASMDAASRITTLYAFLPTSSIAANWFGHVIAVRNSAATVRRHYGDVMRRECGRLIQRLVVQLKRERHARRVEYERRSNRPAPSQQQQQQQSLASLPCSPVGGALSESRGSVHADSGDPARSSPVLGPSSPLEWPHGGPALPPVADSEDSASAAQSGAQPGLTVTVTAPQPSTGPPRGTAVLVEESRASAHASRSERPRHSTRPTSFFARLFGVSTTTTTTTPGDDSRASRRAESAPSSATPAVPPANTSTSTVAGATATNVGTDRRGSPTFPAKRPFPRPSGLGSGVAESATRSGSPSKANTATGNAGAAAAAGAATPLVGLRRTGSARESDSADHAEEDHSPLTPSSPTDMNASSAAAVAGTAKTRTFLRLFPLLEGTQSSLQHQHQHQQQQQQQQQHTHATVVPSSSCMLAGTSTLRSPSSVGVDMAGTPSHKPTSARNDAAGTLTAMHSTASFSTADPTSVPTSATDVTALAGAAGASRDARSHALAAAAAGAVPTGFTVPAHLGVVNGDVRPTLEAFVVSDVVCNWAYTERETEQLKFNAYALEWDMGYELALSMKRLRRYREDVHEATLQAQRQQAQPQSPLGSAAGDRGWRRGPGSPVLPTSGSRRALTEDDPSWAALRQGLLARIDNTNNNNANAMNGAHASSPGTGQRLSGADAARSSALFTVTQVDDLFAAMMLKNAAICAQQESWVGSRQRQEAHALNAATATTTPAGNTRTNASSPADLANAGPLNASLPHVQDRVSAGGGGVGKVRAVTNDPRAQWWRAVAHAWRTHNLPFILSVAIGQLEYGSLTGDVQYCTVLYILFCLWWRMRHEEAATAAAAAAGPQHRRAMDGRELAGHLAGAAAVDPAAVQRAWAAHGARLQSSEDAMSAPARTTTAAAGAYTSYGSGSPCPLCPAPDRSVLPTSPSGSTQQQQQQQQQGTRHINSSSAAKTAHAVPGVVDAVSVSPLSGYARESGTLDLLQFALQLSPCTPAEWKLRALQWLGSYTNALYALRLYVPLNELLLIVPEILQEPTNPIQPRAADIGYEKQMTYVCCGTCPKSELIAAVPRGTGVEAVAVRGGRGAAPHLSFQRGLLDPLRAIRQAALAALRLHQQRRRQQKQQQQQQRRRRRRGGGGGGGGRPIQQTYSPTGLADARRAGVGDNGDDDDDEVAFSDRTSGGSTSSDGLGGTESTMTSNDDALPYTTSSDDDEDGVPTPLVIELPAVVMKGRVSTPVPVARSHHRSSKVHGHHSPDAGVPVTGDVTSAHGSGGGGGGGPLDSSTDAPRLVTSPTEREGKSSRVDDPLLSGDADAASWASTCASDEGHESGVREGKTGLTARTLQRLRGSGAGLMHDAAQADVHTSSDDDDDDRSASEEANLLAMARLRNGEPADGAHDDDDDAIGLGEEDNADTAVALMRGHRLPENAVCPICHDTQAMRCVICEEVVEGLFYWLRSCGHGGHVQHMEEWLQLADECPRCGVTISEVMRAPT